MLYTEYTVNRIKMRK
uniref:Uncharacterized protein n=1 Tax=Anguilla anguilla TaxID=7936 RepID=A0A0E9V9K4_ANGAN